jgi:23S rRNA pseudouridine2605 synthase
MEGVRIAVALSRAGVASRREAEGLIEQGLVTVNGHTVAHPSLRVTKEDCIKLGNRVVRQEAPKVYYLVNKPKGRITGRRDPEGRKSVLDLVEDLPFRVEPVGRLDFNTEGALLLTNDGEMANCLTQPSNGVPKRYWAKVYRTPNERTLDKLRKGIRLEDGRTAPCKCRVLERTEGGNAWVEITVTEGRNRLIRRVFESLGHPVSKLRRMSFGTISVRDLAIGAVRRLSDDEVERLRAFSEGRRPPGRAPRQRSNGRQQRQAARGASTGERSGTRKGANGSTPRRRGRT